MRIFIIPGTFDGANLGDVAMAQVAISRFKNLWPEGVLSILTRGPEFCEALCPGAEHVSFESCKHWFGALSGSWKRWLPQRNLAAKDFAEKLLRSDLVALAGSGVLTDAFKPTGLRLLATLGAAAKRRIPTVILGQGIGPIHDFDLRHAAAEVLPRVNRIFVREAEASMALLRELNVPEKKMDVTGDDALELSWERRISKRGDCIGVNLRLAPYAGITTNILGTVREVLMRTAAEHGTGLLGIPIARGEGDSDLRSLNGLFSGDARECEIDWKPEAVIDRVSRCRLVVAGSYHAGVFALAQGIPVVAIVQSEYYAGKFQGLARQFGGGCEVVYAKDEQFPMKLNRAIKDAWLAGADLKASLLMKAEHQIQTARAAYQRLPEVISNSKEGQR